MTARRQDVAVGPRDPGRKGEVVAFGSATYYILNVRRRAALL